MLVSIGTVHVLLMSTIDIESNEESGQLIPEDSGRAGGSLYQHPLIKPFGLKV